jgi:DNA polymerase-3 subunit delta
MVTLDLRKLQQRLEGGKAPAPLYLLMGDEPFLVQEAVALLKARSVEPGSQDFNCDVFDTTENSPEQVKDAAEVLPMMSTRRFVLYRGVDELKDKEWEELYPLLDNPVESTVLVMTCEALDKRKKAFKRLAEKAVTVELKRPYENQILDWIDYLAHQHALTVTREAGQLLRQFVGTNLTELNNELLKLRDFLGGRQEIAAQDVLQVVSQTRVDRIFDLTDAIGRRDKVSALQCLANLLEHGQSEVGVLAMISRHFRILAQLREGQKEGLSGPRLSTKAGVPQFLLGQYVDQIRHWDEAKIARTFAVLLDTDRALKSSSVPSHVWLENFVLQTCG